MQRYENYIYVLILILAVIGLALLFTMRSEATVVSPQPKVTICHCPDGNPDNCQTQSVGIPASFVHLTQHDNDYAGACQVPEVTPTEEPTPTPSEEPTPTPSREEPKGPETIVRDHHDYDASCPDTKPGQVANINVVTGTPNDNTLTVQWALPLGAEKVVIWYGTKNGQPEHSVTVDNVGSFDIGGLTNGTHYWFAVSGKHGCAVGEASTWVDPLP